MIAREIGSTKAATAQVPVWDWAVRIGHWLLVAAFTIAYVTAEEESDGPDAWHVWSGYVIGAIIALRIVWGFVGPQHARFGDFVRGPIAALSYLADLLRGRARRYMGHSPAGGAMVILLLAFLAATVVTGLMAYGEAGKGPLAANVTWTTTAVYAAENEDEHARGEGRGEEEESAVGELHGALANITLGLIVLHILGVGLASVVHRENLVMAMIAGKKRAED